MTTTPHGSSPAAIRALSDVLWHERDLLDSLLYRLEVQQLILSAGMTARLARATQEVEDVLEQIRRAEIGRSVEAANAATLLSLPADATLREIAAAAPAPWDELLGEHHREFVTVTAAIGDLARGNHTTVAAAHQATQETLLSVQASTGTYDSRGSARSGATDGQIFDGSL